MRREREARGPLEKDPVVLSLDCRADHTGATILTQQSLRQARWHADLSVAVTAERVEMFAMFTRGDKKLPSCARVTRFLYCRSPLAS